jgi:hypothetical protein
MVRPRSPFTNVGLAHTFGFSPRNLVPSRLRGTFADG